MCSSLTWLGSSWNAQWLGRIWCGFIVGFGIILKYKGLGGFLFDDDENDFIWWQCNWFYLMTIKMNYFLQSENVKKVWLLFKFKFLSVFKRY